MFLRIYLENGKKGGDKFLIMMLCVHLDQMVFFQTMHLNLLTKISTLNAHSPKKQNRLYIDHSFL